ncbi:MAG: penicillin-binding protein activator LpoB [Zoogloea sp.]|nr:penicillin-binding protein activator LpoB [Zoogloea sp.]
MTRRLVRDILASILIAASLAGCSSVVDYTSSSNADRNARWALLPFVNSTETPYAGQRAEAITESLLRTLGVRDLVRYPPPPPEDSLVESAQARNGAGATAQIAWARQQGARYAVSGTVEEWRYKVGVDGEPAVGMALHITDLSTGNVIWSGVGGKSGWSRESLAAVAQKLTRALLEPALR